MGKRKGGTPILAAGGVLFDERGRVAVIHRPRYDDWCLPKGKLAKRESEMQAALREVQEETCCIAAPERFLGTVYYEVNQRPKLVFFWRMVCASQAKFTPNGEVDEMAWLTPASALRRLVHPDERRMVRLAMRKR